MTLYLEQGEELAPEQLHAPFEKALREGHLIPVCFTSAKTGAGIPEFLRHPRAARAERDRGQPAAVREERDDRGRGIPRRARPHEARPRPRLQDRDGPVRRQGGLLPRPPGHDHARTRSSTSATASGPFKVGHLYSMQGKDYVEVERARARRHRRGREGRRDRVRRRAARLARRGPHPPALARISRRPCTASRWRRRRRATSSASSRCCTSWRSRIRASGSSATRPPTRP